MTYKKLFLLIKNNLILSEDQIKPEKEINICFIDKIKKREYKTIKIDETRTTFTVKELNGEELDTTIIQLKPETYHGCFGGSIILYNNKVKETHRGNHPNKNII